MATQKQDPQMAADAINRIASNQLGVPTQQAQTQQPAPPATQQQPPKQQQKDQRRPRVIKHLLRY